jgi:carbamoyltransferase
VVHTDGTARVQVVDTTDMGMAHLMRAYRALSGRRVLLNTSLNMHEEPLVLTPTDAVRCFRSARLDALQLGPFVVLGER